MSSNLRIDLSGMAPQRGAPTDEGGGSRRSRWARRIWLGLFCLPIALLIPFAIVLRGSLEYQARLDLGTVPALTLGLVTAAVFLALLAWIASRVLGLPAALRWAAVRGAALAVFGLAGMGLATVGTENVKSADIAEEYRELHPLLRMASATLILVDGDAVVTDASRTLADYATWGLAPNEASLHFVQEDGWAHALDLRTAERPEWRNRVVQRGFELMGFRTLRHGGTADHLHVSMPQS